MRKRNPQTKKVVQVSKAKSDFLENLNQNFLRSALVEVKVLKKTNRKYARCSLVSNSVLCDLNSNVDILKLHDKFPGTECKYQKQTTLLPRQYSMKKPD